MAETLAQRFIQQKIKPKNTDKIDTAAKWMDKIKQFSGDENVQVYELKEDLENKIIEGRSEDVAEADMIHNSWYLGDTDVLLNFKVVDKDYDRVDMYVSLLVESPGRARITGIMSPQGSDIPVPDLASQVVKYLNCQSGSCIVSIF